MRLFIFSRHAESARNAAGVLSSDPSRPIRLTPRGTEQARQLGQQLAKLNIDLAVATRFLRTPHFFDETALRNAVERLDALAAPAPRDESRTEVVG